MMLSASRPHSLLQHRPLAVGLALALPAVAVLASAIAAAPLRAAPIHRSPSPSATTWPVTHCADDGSAGSLRSVVAGAASGDVIDLSQLTCSTITLTQGEITVNQNDLTLNGPGASALTISGGGASRVFDHTGKGRFSLSAIGVTNGYSTAGGGCIYTAGSLYLSESTVSSCKASISSANYGGGALVAGDATIINSKISDSAAYCGGGLSVRGNLSLVDSTISNNRATTLTRTLNAGGGIFVAGPNVSILRSTLSGNHSDFTAGAIYAAHRPADPSDHFSLSDSTISGNTIDVSANQAGVGGAFILMSSSTISNSTVVFNRQVGNVCALYFGSSSAQFYSSVYLQSSIISNNVSANPESISCDLTSGLLRVSVDGTHNIIGSAIGQPLPADTISTDPLLLPLADNGGTTWTHALAVGSPAIDHGNNLLNLEFDQRGQGYPRVYGIAADIGAFEVQQSSTAPSLTTRFMPAAVMVDNVSMLTITLTSGNPAAATLTSPLIDQLPAPLVLANPPVASTTCPGGSVQATAGSDSVTLDSGAQIPAHGSCTVTASVRSHTAGTFTNLIPAGALQADSGSNADPASADLVVTGQAVPPSVTKAFAPNTIAAGATSTLTIALANSHPNAATLTAALGDDLPLPLVVADPPQASTTCPGGTVTAPAGAGSVSLNAGAQIPSGTCTITVKVTTSSAGAYLNTIPIGALQTDFGNNPDAARAGLTVTPAIPADRIFANGFDG